MDNLWLPRYAFLVAVSALILLIAGAVTAPDTVVFRYGLFAFATLSGALQIWLIIFWRVGTASQLANWLMCAIGLDGFSAGFFHTYPKAAGIAHSCLLSAIFCLAAAIALLCSVSWRKTAVLLEDRGSPSLRSLAVFCSVSLAGQVGLGASVHRDAISIIPHIVGAMLVAAIILYLVMAVFMQYPSHPELKNPSILLSGLIGTQVMLGIGAFLHKVGAPVLAMPPKVFPVAHIVTGSLTMAMTVILAMRIFRHIHTSDCTDQPRLAVNS